MRSLQKPVLWIFLVTLILGVWGVSWAIENVRLHLAKRTNVPWMLIEAGEEKGFYAREGLQVLPILATPQAGLRGLLRGSFHFTQLAVMATRPMEQGNNPLRIIMVYETQPLLWLYGSKKIQSLQDLKGRGRIGVPVLGGGVEHMTREVLRKSGIHPERDVVIQQTAATRAARLAALISETIEATPLNLVEALAARRHGLRPLVFYGDVLEAVTTGVATTEKMLSTRPHFVYRFLRSSLRGLYWFRSRKEEVLPRMMNLFRIPFAEADQVYRAMVAGYTTDGTVPRDFQEHVLAMSRKELGLKQTIVPTEVFDFTTLQSIIAELKEARANLTHDRRITHAFKRGK